MSPVKFLIVTTVLDGVTHLGEALSSVQRQSYPHWRHLIIDAGSTDGSLALAHAHAQRDERVICLERPGASLYGALTEGLGAHTDEETVLSWLNCDDAYTPWAFDAVARAWPRAGHLAWISGLPACWDNEGQLRAVLPVGARSQRLIAAGWHNDAALGCLQQESIFFSTALFDALDADERQRFEGAKLAGDFWLWRCLAKRAPLQTLPSVLGGFRVTGQNRSIREAQAYETEMRALGGRTLPSYLRRPVRNVHDSLSAIAHVRAARRAMAQLHSDVPSASE